MSVSSSSARRPALHPSALSDAEHALFMDLANTPGDLKHISGSCARRVCGSAGLESGTVDEILRLFAPATTLSSGAFFAALRLVLYRQAGRGVDRGLAFVQGALRYYCYLPLVPSGSTPLPPRKLTSPTSRKIGATSSEPSSTSSSAPPRRTHHAHSFLLSLAGPPSPPTHPRLVAPAHLALYGPRDAAHRIGRRGPAPPRSGTSRKLSTGSKSSTEQNPTPPPRRASLSTSASVPISPKLLAPPFLARGAYPSSAGPRTTSFAPQPPVHPQRRASAFEAAYGTLSPPSSGSPTYATHAHDGRRDASDSMRRPSSLEFARFDSTRERTASTSVLPLTLPKALRRTLVGTAWVGAERGEREGLVRGRGGGGGYTVRNGRRGAEEGGEGDEGEAWGAL
ncbi:hypothetical protein B0H17DRAFT_1212526 [Mycena rosella]|uniref:Uncharacterized protein n=1 Tax=Mycena rosella TaxID=1033263 RepID=A0AAD7G641_MYCRO|nr:hypothetical protein B0H17DRAFT_1212526 [Mycena rosella]